MNYVDPSGHWYIKRSWIATTLDSAISAVGANWMFTAIKSYAKKHLKKALKSKVAKKAFMNKIVKMFWSTFFVIMCSVFTVPLLAVSRRCKYVDGHCYTTRRKKTGYPDTAQFPSDSISDKSAPSSMY